jgi:hypothetical protein
MPIADLSFKSCELIPSFIKQYLILLTLQLHSNLGMKQGLEGQTRAQKRQGDFKDNSIVVKTRELSKATMRRGNDDECLLHACTCKCFHEVKRLPFQLHVANISSAVLLSLNALNTRVAMLRGVCHVSRIEIIWHLVSKCCQWKLSSLWVYCYVWRVFADLFILDERLCICQNGTGMLLYVVSVVRIAQLQEWKKPQFWSE